MHVVRGTRYYVGVGLGLALLVAATYGGAYWLSHPEASGGLPVSGSTPGTTQSTIGTSADLSVPANVAVVPIPTLEPEPFPTPISQVPAASSATSVPWTVTKVTDPQFLVDYWMAPPDVVARVRQNFQEMDSYYRAHVFDLRPDDERAFYVEPHLDDVIRSDREDQARNEARGRADLVRPDLRILSFSADGAAVQVSQEFHGEPVPVFDRRTHQLIREERSPVGLAIFTLVYDSSDDRWKICSTTFVPGPPGLK